MDSAVLVAFLGLALVLIPVPGPDFFFMLTTGMRYHAVLRPVAGVAAGHLMLVALVVVGLGPLVSAHPVALKVLTVVGGLYLLYLGATVLRSVRSASFTGGDGTGPDSVNHLIRQGFGVAALNPKSLLFYAAILPQFVRPGAGWPVPLQFSVLSVVFLAGLLTGRRPWARSWTSPPRRCRPRSSPGTATSELSRTCHFRVPARTSVRSR
ncbi:LysE family translocator [Corynebacterium bovis]|uniref:LysE family translocator n=1 Tax=Corynebacterium bovis TaxID=36808 RepID=UPI000F636B4C|nr:LysE family translocator [Corynebacterium bovis]RRO86945.1 hypothetical protein CXF30_07715 [Corynebacterium bovis]